jgi:hypothetical protein
MAYRLLLIVSLGMILIGGAAQPDVAQEASADATPSRPFVRGGVHDKPFIAQLGRGTSIGGYTEVHFRFERTEGVNEEVTFDAKRFNIFTYTPVTDRVRVASELEFEEGGEEIKIEIAAIDFEVHEALTFRGGVILSPLGRFNLAHDSPANDLTDRPLVSTEIIGTALSEAGMGLFGAFYPSANSRLTYEIYGVNGFNDGVLIGSEAGTRIPAGKGNFENNNQNPAFVGRVAISPHPSVEVGASGHTGPYNVHDVEGLKVDEKRSLTIFALDGELRWDRFELLGEYVHASIDVPDQLLSLQAEKQQGLYLQGNIHFLRGGLSALPKSVFTGVVRYGLVDFDTDIDGDKQDRLTLGLNFRPTEDTVFKLDYQYNWLRDRFNLEARSAAFLFSTATYF